jgi:hypothetical protein
MTTSLDYLTAGIVLGLLSVLIAYIVTGGIV